MKRSTKLRARVQGPVPTRSRRAGTVRTESAQQPHAASARAIASRADRGRTQPSDRSFCQTGRVTAWSQLTPEQRAVMVNAVEESFLVNVLDEWRARALWADTGSTLTSSDLDDAAQRQLIPRFALVVADLITRGWIELSELQGGTAEPVPLSGRALRAVLNDPDSWVRRSDLRHRLIELITTDRWDQHVAETA